MPGLDLCQGRVCRQGSPLLPEKGNQPATAQGRVYFRGGEVTSGASGAQLGGARTRPCLIERFWARKAKPMQHTIMEHAMMLTRRVFGSATVAAALATAGLFAPAWANTA